MDLRSQNREVDENRHYDFDKAHTEGALSYLCMIQQNITLEVQFAPDQVQIRTLIVFNVEDSALPSINDLHDNTLTFSDFRCCENDVDRLRDTSRSRLIYGYSPCKDVTPVDAFNRDTEPVIVRTLTVQKTMRSK